MNILITGIHGFVGSNLVAALQKYHTIYGLDIIAPEMDGVVETYMWKDLKNNILPQIDVVIHLAGKAHDTKNQSKAQEYFDINTKLTQKIYDYFLSSSAKRFIFFSSVKAAADFVTGNILTEDIVPAPNGPYGESKIAAENYILSKPTPDKRVYILRPCMIHGLGNKGNLNLLYSIVNKGVPWPLGAYENRRSFTSVDNLCYVIQKMIAKDIPSGIYNMGDDEALSTNELIDIMCLAMGRRSKIWKVNPTLIDGLAKLGTMLHLPLNDERLRKLTENYVVSNAKIKLALGIKKMPITAQEGLTKTIQSFEKIKI
ncbi:MAG: NAD-dependent epimerase/dehydratase family protein [Bacteroidota bacterium]|nr:NAD-dependent epimerase/dehydratase family protein [Bacteroidota bacterium]